MRYLPQKETKKRDQSKSKSTLSCLLTFATREIKFSRKKGNKKYISLHGQHSLQSEVCSLRFGKYVYNLRSRREAETNISTGQKEKNKFANI